MSLPSWMDMQCSATETDAAGQQWAVCTVTYRRWHPGYWWAVVRTLLWLRLGLRIGIPKLGR